MYAGCGTYGGHAGLGGSRGVGVLGTYGGHAGLGYYYTDDNWPTGGDPTAGTPGDEYTLPEEIGEWYELGQETADLWSRLTGSSHCWRGYGNRPFAEPCPGTPSYDAVARAVARAPQADIDKLIGYLRGGNDGRGPKSRAELQDPKCLPFWVKAVLGGKGCVNSKYPNAPTWFKDFVVAYGAPQTPTETVPGSAIPDVPGLVKQTGAAGAAAAAAILALIFLPRLLK